MNNSTREAERSDTRLDADEVDLLNLWISIWNDRRLFLIVALVVFIGSVVYLETRYFMAQNVVVRSLIAIETTHVDGVIQPVVPTATLVKQIQLAKLPYFSSLDRFTAISGLIPGTGVDFIGNTNLVQIVNNAPVAMEGDLIAFHRQLVDDVLGDLEKSSDLYKARFRDELYSVNARITRLEGIIIELEHGQPAATQVQGIMQLRKQNIDTEIDILKQRAAHLEDMISTRGSEALVRASVSKNAGKLSRAVAYLLAIMLSLLAGIVGILIARFVARVKQRMVPEG